MSPNLKSPNSGNIGRFNPNGKFVKFKKSTEKELSLLSPKMKEDNAKEKVVSLLSPNLKKDKVEKKLISLISLENL